MIKSDVKIELFEHDKKTINDHGLRNACFIGFKFKGGEHYFMPIKRKYFDSLIDIVDRAENKDIVLIES